MIYSINIPEHKLNIFKVITDACVYLPKISLLRLVNLASKGDYFINDDALACNIMTMINAELIKKEFVPVEVAGKYICLGCGQLTNNKDEHFIPPKTITIGNVQMKQTGLKHHHIPGHYTCLQNME